MPYRDTTGVTGDRNYASKPEEKKTSEYWYNQIYPNKEIVIRDPDGWDRRNWQFSWYEEKITEEEFQSRVAQSTISRLKNS
jgi:hypothetical protein